jgi:hypothetical protein
MGNNFPIRVYQTKGAEIFVDPLVRPLSCKRRHAPSWSIKATKDPVWRTCCVRFELSRGHPPLHALLLPALHCYNRPMLRFNLPNNTASSSLQRADRTPCVRTATRLSPIWNVRMRESWWGLCGWRENVSTVLGDLLVRSGRGALTGRTEGTSCNSCTAVQERASSPQQTGRRGATRLPHASYHMAHQKLIAKVSRFGRQDLLPNHTSSAESNP